MIENLRVDPAATARPQAPRSNRPTDLVIRMQVNSFGVRQIMPSGLRLTAQSGILRGIQESLMGRNDGLSVNYIQRTVDKRSRGSSHPFARCLARLHPLD